MAKCVHSKVKNLFAVSDLNSKLFVSEMWLFFLPRPAFINFIESIIITLLKIRGIEENQIKMKR